MSTSARLPPETLSKLEKLLLRCSSDHDGERAAATVAIGRLLKSHGADWHDLTALLHRGETSVLQPASPPPSSWQRTSGPIDLPRAQLLELIDIIEDRISFLPMKSAEFLDSLRQRTRLWPTIRLTERQWAWFQDLLQKTGV
jgi:hypothetical protein